MLAYIEEYIDLTEEETHLLLEHVSYRKYLKGQYILQAGDICKYENFIISGCVKTFYIDAQGQEHIAMFGIENWWTADLGSFLNQTPADYNVLCLENTEVIQFSFDLLERLFVNLPKMERLFRIIIQKAYVASEKRVIRNFSLSARDRYLQFRKQYPQIEQRVPQYMIASYLGITKEFLSKIRSQLISEQ